MPPNKKGGKNYKKGKHIDDEPIIYERLPDQMYGRVLKLLGGCNVRVYCNDDKERLCHIRGNMRKKVWISEGDIVLISVRDLSQSDNNDGDKGDICARYDQKVIYRLRDKDKTINERLFTIDKTDSCIPVDNEGFVFESNNKNVEEEETESEKEEKGNTKYTNRIAQRRAMMIDDDIDIDAI